MACFICGLASVEEMAFNWPKVYQYHCPDCGGYTVPKKVKDDGIDKSYLIAGYLFEKNRDNYDLGDCLELNKEKIKEILEDETIPKTTMQRLEKLLLHFYRKNEYIWQEQMVDMQTPPSIAYAKNSRELLGMLCAARDQGWLIYHQIYIQESDFLSGNVVLTVAGLQHAEQLLSTNINSKKVFVAMKFSDDLKEAYKMAIQPACYDCGFDAHPISDKEHNNCIMDEIIVEIKTSKFIIADFTYDNSGAYYEAGYAQGRGLEVIRCCKKEWFDENGVHFDTSHYNIILWKDHTDLTKQLKDRIRATIDGAKMED